MGGLVFFDFKIDGKVIPAPEQWQDINVLATFDNEAVQANISLDAFTFLGLGVDILKGHVEGGKTGGVGIFEALSFSMSAKDDTNSVMVFDGFMDFDTYEEISPVRIKCGVKKLNGMNSLAERAAATTFTTLRNEGLFPDNSFIDIKYVIEKEVNALEIIMMLITLFNMIKELADSIKRLVEAIANVVKAATPDVTTPASLPNIGQIIAAIILILIDIVIIVLLSIAITELVQQLIETFISPIRNHKASYQRNLLKQGFKHLGFGFVSPLTELDLIAYLPSAPTENEPITVGLPNTSDFGYFFGDMVEIILRQNHAKIAIIDNDVHIRTKKDPFWVQNSTYVFPDVLDEMVAYNTEELNASILIQFQTDLADDFTIDNFRGTVFGVETVPKVINKDAFVLIKNREEINIPCALGTRKTQLNDLELVMKDVVGFGDALINALGGSSSQAKKIDQRVGMLKMSGRIHRVPKLIPIVGGFIPKDERDIYSARVLWEKYINYLSFIDNNFSRQQRVFVGRRIPFGLGDFIKLIKNSYFVTQDGRSGKFISIEWNLASDTAIATFEVQEKYTSNLKENDFEPS